MIKVLFVCHGNICRSPMAEFIFRDLAAKHGVSAAVQTASAATSAEEIGNPVYPAAKCKLLEHGITCEGKRAVQLTRADYENYDYLIGMENRNLINMQRILGPDKDRKVFRLLDFSPRPRDISDPWYSDDFDTAWKDICEGCEALLQYLAKRGELCA
ncbi:low molecular weight protein-tyrosine-phosphatase [Anaerotruncus rubiinfantis]|uniref:low molecular weight protein-tyrosine-phosphatase n=1 Tax=Anaerotruncus rubiinfantis TaxID=1720200 RepID=UPI00082D59D3|nr:low molecular weight protein-tyrosine-phosphatase [Anaerotruncus rubiinfantis]